MAKVGKRPKPGDVLEIRLSEHEYAYAQFVMRHPMMGDLIRVFEAISSAPPIDLQSVIGGKPLFVTFLSIYHAIKEGTVAITTNLPLPTEAQRFPLFRASAPPSLTRGTRLWTTWNGVEYGKTMTPLTPELKRLPIAGLIDDELLKERIRMKWRAEEHDTPTS